MLLGSLVDSEELEERESRAKAMSVARLVDLYLKRRVVGRLRSAPSVARVLERVLEPLASLPAADVRKRDLAPLFEAIAASGHERAAGKARVLVGGMFKWAETQAIVASDPTRGLQSYDQGTPRDRVLDEDELRALWPWLDTLPIAFADAVRVQLLTGARIGEVAGMTAKEVDRDKWLWTLPEARSKSTISRSSPPNAAQRPSGEKTTLLM